VLCYIFAGLHVVGRINPNRYTASEKASIKGKAPLRGIKPNNIDGSKLPEFVSDQRFGELEAFFVILFEINSVLNKTVTTHTPFCLTERASRVAYSYLALRNSSMRVVGGMADVPALPIRIGNSVLKLSVHKMFLAGKLSSLGRLNIFCKPSEEMQYSLAV
jgi:hypothetical protein